MDAETEEIRHGYQVCTSRAEYNDDPGRWLNYAHTELRLSLAEILREHKAKTTMTDNMVELRLEVYAATPEKFWAIVQKEAERIAFGYMR